MALHRHLYEYPIHKTQHTIAVSPSGNCPSGHSLCIFSTLSVWEIEWCEAYTSIEDDTNGHTHTLTTSKGIKISNPIVVSGPGSCVGGHSNCRYTGGSTLIECELEIQEDVATGTGTPGYHHHSFLRPGINNYTYKEPTTCPLGHTNCAVLPDSISFPTAQEGQGSQYTGYNETAPPPVAELQPSTSILTTSATVNGRITDDAGSSCEYRFRYRIYGGEYSYTTWANGKVTDDTFSEALTGLTKRSLYEFAAQARNPVESAWTASMYFRTLPASVTPQIYQTIERKVTLEAIRNLGMSVKGQAFVDKEGNFRYESRFGRHL